MSNRKKFDYDGRRAALSIPGGAGLSMIDVYGDFKVTLFRGHTGTIFNHCKKDVVRFVPDGYEWHPIDFHRCYLYIQGNPDKKNLGYKV